MLIPYVDGNLVLKYKAAFILSLYNFYSYAITKIYKSWFPGKKDNFPATSKILLKYFRL